MAAIQIENLQKTFQTKDGGVEALKDINLSIEKGDIYGIIGMSGAGKSTLVRCINYLERPTEGDVYINGNPIGGLKRKELQKQREKIAMIFQHFNLLMQKNVLDNVCFPMYIQKKNKREAKKRALELLELVGLADKVKAYPSQLSGGQKQRVAIARALACNPEILLCDEATSALDPQTTSSILNLLKDINERFGITIVIITHQMSVVREICSHVAIMQEGQIIETGTVSNVFAHPKSEVARQLFRLDNASEITNIQHGKQFRIVFTENSAFEPVIANLILKFGEPVNILKASTKNVGGVAKGEMILEFQKDSINIDAMKQYLVEKGLELEEVVNNVDA